MEGKTVQEKYEAFLIKYNEGIQRYVPLYKVKKSKQVWFNAICAEAKKIRDKAWKKLKKQRNEIHREQYKEARNEYITIRREEQRM